MQVFKNEMTISFDVDDTLVMWEGNIYKPEEGRVAIPDPYDNNDPKYLIPHTRHINFLKKSFKRGYQVTVWSAGGWAWAESVVKTLGLEEFVAKVETKPIKLVDDLPVSEGVGVTMYLPFNNKEEG